MSADYKEVLTGDKFNLTIERLAYQVYEEYSDKDNFALIGIQQSGVVLSDYLKTFLKAIDPDFKYHYGKLDITFYRDDFRRREKPITASTTEMNFLVEQSNVLLVDDVLYTGRTIQSALIALGHYGRPKSVESLHLVDRRFVRQVPILSNYAGIIVDEEESVFVDVQWDAQDENKHKVVIYSEKK